MKTDPFEIVPMLYLKRLGFSVRQIADITRCHPDTVSDQLIAMGSDIPRGRRPRATFQRTFRKEVLAIYRAGATVEDLALFLGFNAAALTNALHGTESQLPDKWEGDICIQCGSAFLSPNRSNRHCRRCAKRIRRTYSAE